MVASKFGMMSEHGMDWGQ